jgi:hypothetical protein
LLVFTSWPTKLFDSGLEFYTTTYTLGASLDNVLVLEEKSMIKNAMERNGKTEATKQYKM